MPGRAFRVRRLGETKGSIEPKRGGIALVHEQRVRARSEDRRADTESLLGKPEAEFTLEPAQTTVLMYEAGASPQNYFVGFESDVIVWIHAQDDWLEHLSKRARKEKN